jgi:hypothetical protein
MAEIFTGTAGKLERKTEEELLQHADTQFLPDTSTIGKIKDAYEGKCSEGDTLTTGAGGIIFAVTELMVDFCTREPVINPNGTMDDNVVLLIHDWMQPNPSAHRPPFKELFASSLREAILSGFVCAERWYPGEDPNAVREAFFNGNTPGVQCENILIRPSEHWCINRSHDTGLILQAPFWYKLDISEDYEESDYIGPLHRDQIFYGALHSRTLTDYYGMSPFAPCVVEITNIGKSFRVAEAIAAHIIKPRVVAGIDKSAGQTEIDLAKDSVEEFLANRDASTTDTALVIPGGASVSYLWPEGMKFKDITDFISGLHSSIFTWLGIPETLFMARSSYATAAVQSQMFEQRMSWYRDIVWGWWEWHFRLILKENGVGDWDITPIDVTWAIEKSDWQSIEQGEKGGKTPRDEALVGEPERTGLGSPTKTLSEEVVPNEGVV